jgi:hypothetical protein
LRFCGARFSDSVCQFAGGFANFFPEFRSATAQDDAKAVGDVTKLPVLFDAKPRDHGNFQKVYPELLPGKFELA